MSASKIKSITGPQSTEKIYNYVEPKRKSDCWLCKEEDQTEMVKCGECSRCFHQTCVGLDKEVPRQTTTRSQLWYCPKCQLARDRTASITEKMEKMEAQLKETQAESRRIAAESAKNLKKLRNENENEMRRLQADYDAAMQKLSERPAEKSGPMPEKSEDEVDLLNSIQSLRQQFLEAQKEAKESKKAAETANNRAGESEVLQEILHMQQKLFEATQKTGGAPSEINEMMEEMLTMQRRAFEEKRVDKERSNDAQELPGLVHALHELTRAMTHKENVNEGTSGRILEKHVLRQEIRKLPEFRGEAKEWPRFKAQYDESTRNGEFSTIQNLVRLQESLKGKALEVVKPLMLNADNVPEIIKQLENRFGQPKLIHHELLQDILKIKIQKGDSRQLMNLSEAINNMVMNLQTIGGDDYLKDPRLVSELVQKLPFSLQMKWATKEASETENLNLSAQQSGLNISGALLKSYGLEDLNDWLKPIAKATIYLPARTSFEKKTVLNVHKENNKADSTKKSFNQRQKNSKNNRKCECCQKEHKLTECEKFKKFTQPKRWELVKEKRVCGGCLLYTNHGIKDCKIKKTCGVNGCTVKHHPLIHKEWEKKPDPNNSESTSVQPVSTNIHQEAPSEVLYKTLPVTLYSKDKTFDTYAFLDDGSSSTLLEKGVAEFLELDGTPEPLHLRWTKGIQEVEEDSMKTSLGISARHKPSKKFTIRNVKTVSQLELPEQTLDMSRFRQNKDFKDLPNLSYSEGLPTILIGLEHSNLLTHTETRVGDKGFPTAAKTKLGWTIYGNTGGRPQENRVYTIQEVHSGEKELHQLIKEFFATENFGVNPKYKKLQSTEEERAEKIINETMKKVGDRYEIGLLWKDDFTSLPNSYGMAKGRLESIEKKLKVNTELQEWYNTKIQEYVEKGYARKMSPAEAKASETHRTFYLPHFVVVNPNKIPLKPRLVFDAAAKINGVSLNTALLTGPDNLAPLYEILLKFREGKIAVTADIKEMFPQVRIREADQQSQRFLWRNAETSRDPDIYVMQVMTFGATCSPACAQAVKNFNAKVHQKENPQAAEAIIKLHYVDDYLNSHHELREAVTTAQGVINIHKKGGFEIRNFISNSRELLDQLPASARATSQEDVKLNEEENNEEKVLGIFWRTQTDELVYKINQKKIPQKLSSRKPTKREILSFVMSLFDPLGLIGHIVIQAKIILQAIWISGTGWDEQIPENLNKRWVQWFQGLKHIEDFRIPRCYSPLVPTADDIQLHVFSDASEEAFSALIYLRIRQGDKIDVSLVAAKTKVAPTKQLSIPRLELQAAVLGCRLADTIKNGLRLKIVERVHWTDSTTVLGWIKSTKRKYKQFVAHRISEILETTTMTQWRHVPTKVNVADEATKITRSNNWFTGPDFLKEDPSKWPQQENLPEPENEVRVMHTSIISQENEWIKTENYSNWARLTKHVAIFMKFIEWVKSKKQVKSGIDLHDLRKAEKIIIKKSQAETYSEEITNLREKKMINNNSQIKNLTPILDEEGILRLDGRIKNAKFLSLEARNPIIMSKKSYITTLIVKDYHEKNAHQGQEAVIASLRQRYWIPAVREIVKRVKKDCQKCKNKAAKPQAPQMGQIPTCKLKPYTKPFTYTGVDYFGPISVTVGRRREKRYGALFTCMTTRAVHIELARDLSTDSFILCLRNVQNRRGKIEEIYSDNGTNFKGADKELREKARNLGIVWSFIPPSSPHFGGSWERLVQAIKKALSAILKEQAPREDTLVSALIEAENIVNSRPLTQIPVEHAEDEPLTPNHFLFGPGGGQSSPDTGYEGEELTRKQWKISQQIAKQFWKRWIREYLPTITRRGKWTKHATPLQKDDVVILVDDELPRNKWKTGRVLVANMAADGQVRSAVIKTSEGTYTRPTVKLAKLDVRRDETKILNKNEEKIALPRRSNRLKQKGSFTGIVMEYGASIMSLQNSTPEWDEESVKIVHDSKDAPSIWNTIPKWDVEKNKIKHARVRNKHQEDFNIHYKSLLSEQERDSNVISPEGENLIIRYCYFCVRTNHTLDNCEIFMARCPRYRSRFVHDNNICALCLRTTEHKASECNEKPCRFKNCNQLHNIIMHGTPSIEEAGFSLSRKEKVLEWVTGLYPDHPYTDASREEAKRMKDQRAKPNVAIPWNDEIEKALTEMDETDLRRNKRTRMGFGHYLLLLCLLFCSAQGQQITPINSTGLMMVHVGTTYALTGIYQWTIDTKVNYTCDRAKITQQIEAMEKYCRAIQSYYPEGPCFQKALELRDQVKMLEQYEQTLSRKRRSQGAFSWLWDFAFGSNDREAEIEMIRIKQMDMERHEKMTLRTVADVFNHASDLSNERVKTIQKYVDNAIAEANLWYRKFDKEIANSQMAEYTTMIMLQLDETRAKYDQLKQKEGFLKQSELENGIHAIRTKLRENQILPEVNITTMQKLLKSEVEHTKEKVSLHIFLPILYNEKFERLQLIAIPKGGHELKIKKDQICLNYESHTYFYPASKEEEIVISPELEIVPNLIFNKVEQRPDCVTATIYKSKNVAQLCEVVQSNEKEERVIKMPQQNEFIIITSEPQHLAVQCGQQIERYIRKADGTTAFHIKTDPGCKIFTKSGFILTETKMEKVNRLSRTFYAAYNFSIPEYKVKEIKALKMDLTPTEKVSFDEEVAQNPESGISTFAWAFTGIVGILITIAFLLIIIYKQGQTKEQSHPNIEQLASELQSVSSDNRHEFDVQITELGYEGEYSQA